MVDQFADSEADGAQLEHVESFPRYTAPRSLFDEKICALLDLLPRTGLDGMRDGRRSAMRMALNNRASWPQIRDWRRGRRHAPEWAIALLDRQIDNRLARLLKSKTAGI